MSETSTIHPDDRRWIDDLRGSGAAQLAAMRRLHEQLTKAARFQIHRMDGIAARLGRERVDELVHSAADDATVAILQKLHEFEGRSRLSTWIYKFGIYHASTEARRTVWRDRTIPIHETDEPSAPHGPEAHATANETARALEIAIDVALTDHQRRIVRAVLLDGIPIDVYAERAGTTRSALYKTIHDARKRLRRELTERGFLAAEAGVNS